MKTKSLFIAGCTVILLLATTFVACEKNPASQPVVDPTTGETYYSIVGKWVYSYTDYYEDHITVTIQLNADHTGTYTVKDSDTGPNGTVYNIRYNYNPKTCLGDMIMMVSGYSEAYAMDFKVKWYGSDIFSSYIQDPDGDWDLTGTFQRQ
jgi:hypothetical protein